MTPKTLNLGNVGGGSSLDVIDWRTASHALVGLKQEPYNWALYRFAGHDDKLRSVIRTLTMTITLFVKIKEFKIKHSTLDGIVRAAIFEFAQPICGVCHGSGVVASSAGNTSQECGFCAGRGRKKISGRERCEIIGIDHKNYTNTHDEVTKQLILIMSTWEQQIIKNVNDKMGEE